MLWIYDNAIAEDLRKSLNPTNVPDPAVTVVSSESAINLAAQIQNDKIRFPVIALTRTSTVNIDEKTTNFTKTKKGIPTTFDNVSNNFYDEKSIPVNLSYELSVFTSNTADMDEIVRELLFKYSSMYFLSVTIPYESKRTIRFGIVADNTEGIQINSTASNYLSEGKLYGSSLTLRCEGCVLVHYNTRKLRRFSAEVETTDPLINRELSSIKDNSVVDLTSYKYSTKQWYQGNYEFTPSESTQIIEISDKTAQSNIVINPIPNNYGRISYDGKHLFIQ